MPTQTPSTIDYYNHHAQEFYNSTVGADMSTHTARFEALLPPGARVLDAGCGSGRDSLHFLQRGFHVTAFDGSQEMVRLASQLTGLTVLHMDFASLKLEPGFDGIWASASLLHLSRAQIAAVLADLARILKPGGVFYMSFKYGDGEEQRGERLFNYYNENAFQALLAELPELTLVDLWTTDDVRPGQPGRWLNAIARKNN
ncbi:MAG TPA: class I SAM-dependent methyltransferase [Anaerolineaceae bacterium]|nr:class I SAM-dependent methyltransferase [Anaerolineaceae bacterium]HPN52447.1 class I SAM-dependent methyltransferase [Anaerolineaceae bacterium]